MLQPEPPTSHEFIEIITDIYVMEKRTFSFKDAGQRTPVILGQMDTVL